MSVKVLLQEVRKSKGLSQNELARLTNMSPQNIQKIEQGEARSLTFKTLSKFCQALQCQPGDLLIYEDELETKVQQSLNKNQDKLTQNIQSNKVVEEKNLFCLEADRFFPRVITQTI
jgi:putative transcriptional regulator